MKGGGTETVKQVSNSEPWKPAQSYILKGMGAAGSLFDAGTPTIPFSPQTEQALRMTENRALSGSPLLGQAGGELGRMIGGDYVREGNPYFSAAYGAATRPVIDQWMSQIAPGIDASFSASGRLGSPAYAMARNRAEDTLARNLTETGATMGMQNYEAERGRQLMGLQMAPGFSQTDYLDAERLAGVGAAREALAEEEVMSPWNDLQRYIAAITGQTQGFGTTSSTSQQPQPYSSPLLGLGLAAASLF